MWPTRLGEGSAIHPERLAGDKRSLIGGEEDDGVAYVSRKTDAAQRRDVCPGFTEVRRFAFSALDLNRAGSDAIHADAVAPKFNRRRFRKHLDGALAGGIGCEIREGHLVASGADIER